MERDLSNEHAITWISGFPLIVAALVSLGVPTYLERGMKALAAHHARLPQFSQLVLGFPRYGWVVLIVSIAIVSIWTSLRLRGNGAKASACIIGEIVVFMILGLIYVSIDYPLREMQKQLT